MNEQCSKKDIPIVLPLACQCLGYFLKYLLIVSVIIENQIPLLSLEKSLLENITYQLVLNNISYLKQAVYKDESIYFSSSSLPLPQPNSLSYFPWTKWITHLKNDLLNCIETWVVQSFDCISGPRIISVMLSPKKAKHRWMHK